MKCLERNKTAFYYANPSVLAPVLNSDGQFIGSYEQTYTTPTEYRANVSPASGRAYADYFGTNLAYEKVIVTDDKNCPIAENSVLWINNATTDKYDYVVLRRSESLNGLLFAIARCEGA